MKRWTKKQWEQHVLANCYDSYSLAVITAAMLEHEGTPCTNEIHGLTGAQYHMALSLAKLIPKGAGLQ